MLKFASEAEPIALRKETKYEFDFWCHERRENWLLNDTFKNLYMLKDYKGWMPCPIFILPMLSVWPKQMWIVRVVQLALTKAQLKPQCVHWSNGLSAIWAMCQGKRYLELPSIGVNIHLRVCCFLIRKIKILIKLKNYLNIIFCMKLLKIMIKKQK